MKIVWHKRADAALHQVENYILEKFGEKVRQEFMDEVEKSVFALADMPSIGQLDPLFATFRQTNSILKVKNCNLGKQTRLFKAIKHQRDKQIKFAYLADI